MLTMETRPPVSSGEIVPDFTLPAVDSDGVISLSDYRGRTPVFLSLLLGLWCPFCRRQIAQLADLAVELKSAGVESLGIVATAPENARLYFKFRPTRLRIAADPELSTHRAYRIPKPSPTPELLQALEATRINPYGELPEPLPIPQAAAAMAQRDAYVENETDRADTQRQWPQLKAQYLIDRDGIARWAKIECAEEGLAGLGKPVPVEEVLAAARTLA